MKSRKLEAVALLYIVVWTISPPLQLDMIYRLLALGCAALLFLLNGLKMTTEQKIVTVFVVAVAITAFISSRSLSGVLGQISVYLLFLGYLMNSWYADDWDKFRWLLPVVLLLLSLWNFRSATMLATDASAARVIVRNSEAANAYLRQGIGGYGLLYSQVCIAPALVAWTVNAWKPKKWFSFACGILWAITFFWFVWEAGYTIAVFTTAAGLVIYFFYRGKKLLPALIISVLLVSLVVYLICYNDTVRNYLLEIFDGTKVAWKIRDITDTFSTGETADSISARIDRYMRSLQTMLKYPLIGSWWVGGQGCHSALLDTLAQYGLFGGYAMYQLVYCGYLGWRTRVKHSQTIRAMNAAAVTITFVALFDTVPYNLTTMLTVILPIVLNDIEDRSESAGHKHTHKRGHYEDPLDG